MLQLICCQIVDRRRRHRRSAENVMTDDSRLISEVRAIRQKAISWPCE